MTYLLRPPPLEAKNMFFSLAVTEGIGYQEGSEMMDSRLSSLACGGRTFTPMHAVPPEDAAPGMCGLLNKSMYGTRDAAQNWECEYAGFMESCGMQRGSAIPCELQSMETTSRS